MGLCNPRQTVIVTCKEGDFEDAVTLSWHSPVSYEPFYYGIFLYKKRKSFEMIKKSGEFCVNILSNDMANLAMFCGTKSGHDTDKFKEADIKREKCRKIGASRIMGCCTYLECKAIDFIELGDHVMVVGEVLLSEKGTGAKKLFQSNPTGGYTFTTTED